VEKVTLKGLTRNEKAYVVVWRRWMNNVYYKGDSKFLNLLEDEIGFDRTVELQEIAEKLYRRNLCLH